MCSPNSTVCSTSGSVVRYRTNSPSTSRSVSPPSASAARAASPIIESSLWSGTLPSGPSATPAMYTARSGIPPPLPVESTATLASRVTGVKDDGRREASDDTQGQGAEPPAGRRRGHALGYHPALVLRDAHRVAHRVRPDWAVSRHGSRTDPEGARNAEGVDHRAVKGAGFGRCEEDGHRRDVV